MRRLLPLLLTLTSFAAESGAPVGKFQQLETTLPSPSPQRLATGAPGAGYWQNRADYDIRAELDDEKKALTAEATVTYHNTSPDALEYLWVQLDQNYFAQGADSRAAPNQKRGVDLKKFSYAALDRLLAYQKYDGALKITQLTDAEGRGLPHAVVKTMLRLDLPKPLKPGEDFVFKIAWTYPINDAKRIMARTGYEFFKTDGNHIYTIAQWFPRMAAYTDYAGWINKQFLGTGEFTLEFGDYKVALTVPDDHVVAATGLLKNPDEVLTSVQRERLAQASKETKRPVFVVTPEEAKAAEKGRPKGKKTWRFEAGNVRDFAFASSRKFIWDAMAVAGAQVDGQPVMAMSLYPKEGMPLWDKYSTHAVAHAIEVYSRHTFDYPYPVAWSVNGAIGGMEYPMICFNYGRPDADGTYSDAIKYGMISVIIHEVGHNYFPMIVNSDERQWTWMDEGLNTFMQFMAEQEWDRNYPSRRGPAHKIVPYMKSEKHLLEPIMTNSENIIQFGPNAYAKPATALNILRETVMGRDLFDFAFQEYSRRWMFKHPTPDDLFRTLEDASAVDLDWFWRGWFYGTEPVDISIENVAWYKLDNRTPAQKKADAKADFDREEASVSKEANVKGVPATVVEADPATRDFYNSYNPFSVTPEDEAAYKTFLGSLSEQEKSLLNSNRNFYEMTFRNIGGLVMPLIVEFHYADGSKETEHIPAEIWRKNESQVTKVFVKEKEVVKFVLDPKRETADIDESSNYWPRQYQPTRFELFKGGSAVRGAAQGDNPMKKANKK